MGEKEKVVIDPSKISGEIKSKYTLTNNAFKMVAKDNPKDRIEAIIGDDKQPDFKPQIKIQRWDNEVNLSVRLVDDEITKPTITTAKGKIVWANVEKDIKFYDLPVSEEHPEGGYEFEVILKEKPVSNVVEFTLNTKGLDFFYQPPLTQEEIDQGVERPENVVGSYAVYASENKTNYVGGKEYKCGKVGHIYRPKIVDSEGTEVWGELNVDVENGILSVAIPQGFLDNAVYPIRHAAGLTFGYTSSGASQQRIVRVGFETNNRLGIAYNGADGTVTLLSAYLYIVTTAETATGYAALNSEDTADNSHDLVVGLEKTDLSLTTSKAKYDFDIADTSISAISYLLNILVDFDSVANDVYLALDTGGSSINYYLDQGDYATVKAENPWLITPQPDTTNQYSIYATYKASGTFPVLESVTDTDFASSVTSMAVNMPATVNAGDRLIALCHVRNAGTWTTVPTDWSNLGEQAGGGSVGELSIFEKIAVGNEDGGTATWVTGTGTTAAWQVIRVSGAHASTASEVTTASGDSSSANPPSESASWGGSENNLWIAVAGHSAASATAFSAAPIGFLGFAQNGASSGGSAVCVAHGYDNYAGDTYDPGTFTVSGSNRWWASATIVVRPAASVSTAVKDMLGGFIPFPR